MNLQWALFNFTFSYIYFLWLGGDFGGTIEHPYDRTWRERGLLGWLESVLVWLCTSEIDFGGLESGSEGNEYRLQSI